MTANVAADILARAMEEVPCPYLPGVRPPDAAYGHPGFACQLCHGTGEVARYRDANGGPLLRVPCRGSASYIVGEAPPMTDGSWIYSCQKDGCPACGGRRWLPVSGPAAVVALLEACESLEGVDSVAFTIDPGSRDRIVRLQDQDGEPIAEPGRGATRLEALCAALTAAREARVP